MKAVKKLILFAQLLVALTSTGQSTKVSPSKSKHPTTIEEKILDTIFSLPECKERASYIKKQTKGKRRLSVVIYAEPTKESPYYWVKAWEDNGAAYATHFDFYVYPTKPLTIKYYDAVSDEAIPLKQWRKQKKGKASIEFL